MSPGHLHIAASGDGGGDSVHGGRAEPEGDVVSESNGITSLRLPVFWGHTEQLG